MELLQNDSSFLTYIRAFNDRLAISDSVFSYFVSGYTSDLCKANGLSVLIWTRLGFV